MRLVKAELSGFGRIASGKINLDSKVLAIVGPNEAGKTTLLKALAYINSGRTLSVAERSRGLEIADDHTVVRVQFILDDEDRAAVEALGLEEAPLSIWVSRTAATTSGVAMSISPVPRKAVAPLSAAVRALRKATTKRALAALDYKAPEPDENGLVPPADSDRESLRTTLEGWLHGFLEEAQPGKEAAAAELYAPDVRDSVEAISRYGITGEFLRTLNGVLAWIDRESPEAAARSTLWQRAPRIEFFDEDDRNLSSTYAISEELLASAPAALQNVAIMADLDLTALWRAMSTGNEGERETLIETANQTLATKFAAAWKQSNITVVLKTEGTTLFIRIKQDGKRITQFDERSAGLQMFVALVAFLAVKKESRPPILLIDEAETHLHIDAQADLVNTFMTQRQAAKIVYTTHSPACLPPDLGSNIRAVVPDPTDPGRSIIEGSFWHGAAGFSPLMIAMGAGAAAFSSARYVVLGEGASEMLVLPSLIKAAIGAADLDYQVAPGLSEVPPDMYPELDLAGARVGYLVDGDQGGLDRRKALVVGGVPEDRIITLGALTLENLIDRDAYLKVISGLLAECNPNTTLPELPTLPDAAVEVWPPFLDRWAQANSLRMPGKRVVASRLVEEQLAIPSEYGIPILRSAHAQLSDVLRRGNSLTEAPGSIA